MLFAIYTLLLFFVTSVLMRALSLSRREYIRRLAECEDSHLARDTIQIQAVQLISEQTAILRTTTGGPHRAEVDVHRFSERAAALHLSMSTLNQQMIERRAVDRERDRLSLETNSFIEFWRIVFNRPAKG